MIIRSEREKFDKSFIKKTIFSLVTTAGLLFLSFIISLKQHSIAEENELFELIDHLSEGFQSKQIITIIGLFFMGRLFLEIYATKISYKLKLSLSFLTGIALWCVSAHLLLLLHIKYSIISVVSFILLTLLLGYVRKKERSMWLNSFIASFYIELPFYFIFVGISVLASTGIFIIMMSGDSYHFVAQFGQILGKIREYNADYMGELLTWTGITPAIVCSLGELLGFESIYGIQTVAAFSFISSFFFLYEERIQIKDSIKRKIICVFPIVIMLSSISLIVLMGWIISSSFWMFYNTLFVLLCFFSEEQKGGCFSIIMLYSLMITITRAEAVIFVAFICICLIDYWGVKKSLWLIVLNSIMQIALLAKLFLLWKLNGSALMSKTNAIIMIIGLIGSILYAFFIRFHYTWNNRIIIVGLIFAGLFVFFAKMDQVLSNIKVTMKNFGLDIWGSFFWIFFLILLYLVINDELGFDKSLLIFGGELVLGFLMNGIRFVGLREGIGDSYCRLAIGIAPIAIYYLIKQLFSGDKDESNKNKESK